VAVPTATLLAYVGVTLTPTRPAPVTAAVHGVSAAPVVTIESVSDSVKLADALALSAITADRTAQRIPVTTARVLAGLRAKLDTPAAGGSVRGNFYIKGVMVQTAF